MYLTHFTLVIVQHSPYPLVAPMLLSVSRSFFVCCFLSYIPQMSEIIRVLSFSVALISLSIILSRSIHVMTNDSISSKKHLLCCNMSITRMSRTDRFSPSSYPKHTVTLTFHSCLLFEKVGLYQTPARFLAKII